MNRHIKPNSPEVESGAAVSNHLPFTERKRAIEDILSGLKDDPKWISSMYFYDSAGSRLFEEITRLPEYYLTRIEKELLKDVAETTARRMNQVDIVEIGSGSCSKISILLEAIPQDQWGTIGYLPVDMSRAAIEEAVNVLRRDFPKLDIEAVVADFTSQLNLIPRRRRRVFGFFGSTIGNLSREEADRFMIDLSRAMRSGERLLLGLDMVKDKKVLEAAYNDSRRITARFNRNILNVANHIAGTDFNPDKFEHVAFYHEASARIEMHLKAMEDLVISSPHSAEPIPIRRGETIHTENSHKYTNDDIDHLASISGLVVENIFTDRNRWFSLVEYFKG